MRTCQNRLSALLPILILALAGLAPHADAKGPTSTMPRTAPAFALPGVDRAVVLDSLKGRVVLVDFWASWCGPCQRSFPWLDSLATRYGGSGLTVVGINLDKDRTAADGFLAKHRALFPIVFDPAGDVAEAYGVRVMPTSYLIDRSGAIVSGHAGFDARRGRALEDAIRALCTQ